VKTSFTCESRPAGCCPRPAGRPLSKRTDRVYADISNRDIDWKDECFPEWFVRAAAIQTRWKNRDVCLKTLRNKAHISQRELGELVHLSQGNISDYERGSRKIETMPAGKFVEILRALGGVDPSVLLGQKEPVVKTNADDRIKIEAEDRLKYGDDNGSPVLDTTEIREKEQYDRRIEKLERRLKHLQQRLDDEKAEREKFISQCISSRSI